MREKKLLISLIRITLIIILGLIVLVLSVPINEEVDIDNTEFSNIDEFLEFKYKNMNYTYVKIDYYYFVSITKRSIRRRTYINEIIYFKDENNYEVLLDGKNIDIMDISDSLSIKLNNSNDNTVYASCFLKIHKDNYLMYIKEVLHTDILNVKDIYGDFRYLKSINYGIEYYFTAIESDKLTEDYLIEVELDDVGTAIIEGDRIIEAFKYIKERDTN